MFSCDFWESFLNTFFTERNDWFYLWKDPPTIILPYSSSYLKAAFQDFRKVSQPESMCLKSTMEISECVESVQS